MATNPLAHPTAMSLGESQAIHVQIVDGGLAVKEGETTLSVCQMVNSHQGYLSFSNLQNSVALGSLLVLISRTLTYPSLHVPAISPIFFKTSSSSSSRLARGNVHQDIRRKSPQSVHKASRNRGLSSISSILVRESSLLALNAQICKALGYGAEGRKAAATLSASGSG